MSDFALLHPDGQLTYGQRRDDESLREAIRAHIPDLGTQGMGRLRAWFSDMFTPDMPANHLADALLGRLGYRHPSGWAGLVALTMEENPATGEPDTLPAEVRATLDELAATVRSPTGCS